MLCVSKQTHEKCCLFRKEKLQEVHELQLFKANQRLLLEWSVKQSSEMAEKDLPKTRAEADQLIVEHQDWKVRGWWSTSVLLSENGQSDVTLNSVFPD